MEIKRIPIVGLIGAAIGIQFALHNNNLFVGFIIMIACWGIAELIGICIASILPKKRRESIDYSTWKVYNLIGRLIAIWFIIIGLSLLGSVWHLFPNKNYTYTTEEQIIFYIASISCIVLGIVFLFKKGDYPKEFNVIREKEEETNK